MMVRYKYMCIIIKWKLFIYLSDTVLINIGFKSGCNNVFYYAYHVTFVVKLWNNSNFKKGLSTHF